MSSQFLHELIDRDSGIAQRVKGGQFGHLHLIFPDEQSAMQYRRRDPARYPYQCRQWDDSILAEHVANGLVRYISRAGIPRDVIHI